VETGCGVSPSENEDGVLLARATGQSEPRQALLRFRDPVAPPEAADREGRIIHFPDLVRQIRTHTADADISLVEGAGGLLSPITWEQNTMDLALAIEARVLLVAKDNLGTINHTLLALKALASNRLDPLGIVLLEPRQPDASTGTNAAAIGRLSGSSRIVCIPYTHEQHAGHERIKDIVDWLQLA
jgi:dethiobiotin synthetase